MLSRMFPGMWYYRKELRGRLKANELVKMTDTYLGVRSPEQGIKQEELE